MSSPRDWARAYARQAQADLAAHDALHPLTALPPCQRLHFLQMTCEKICKASLIHSGTEPVFVQASHAYTAAVLPIVFQEQRRRLRLRDLHPRSTLMKQVRSLSREIELLAPTVDSLRRPDNCEYPWEDAEGNVMVPAEHSFATLTLLTQQAGLELLKILPLAIDELLT